MCEASGRVRVDRKTKQLVKRLRPSEIAVIAHRDLDEVAADSLIKARPGAVINTEESISGRYPNPGPEKLIQAGVPLIDEADRHLMKVLEEGDAIEVRGGRIFRRGRLIGRGREMGPGEIERKMDAARTNLQEELVRFVDNTLEYARREKDLILGDLVPPRLQTPIRDRHVLIVVRGKNYREDLEAIFSYVRDVRPVIIGVDGGADAVLEQGYTPDIIVGDMDSVTDEALEAAREIVVHAYPDGRAPGLSRVRERKRKPQVFRAPGTSEDIAMLLAHEMGAGLIVALGAHTSMIDFLEKGREGMASTFLVRMRVGAVLVDAKGLSELYGCELGPAEMLRIILAALLPVCFMILISPGLRQYLRLIILRLWTFILV